MSLWDNSGSGSDSEEDDYFDETDPSSSSEATGRKFHKRSHLLVIIDTGPSMFEVPADQKRTYFQIAAAACAKLAENIMVDIRLKSRICVVLQPSGDVDHTFDTPQVDQIQFLSQVEDMSHEEVMKYKGKSKFVVSDTLLSAKRLFAMVTSKDCMKYVLLITNNDNPVAGDLAESKAALHEAANIGQNITLDVVTLNPEFDFEVFYGKVLEAAGRQPEYLFIPNEEALRDKLSYYCIYHQMEKTVAFHLFEDKSYVISCKEARFVKRDSIVKHNAYVTKGTHERVFKEGMRTSAGNFKIEDLDVVMTPLQVKELYKSDLPIGYHFVDITAPSDAHAPQQTPDIIYAQDNQQIFGALWDEALKNNEVLLCIQRRQRNKPYRHVELFPVYIDKRKCFRVHSLFYSVDRHIGNKTATNENYIDHSEKQVAAATELIKSMEIEYNRDAFPCGQISRMREYIRTEMGLPERDDKELDMLTRQYFKDANRVNDAIANFQGLVDLTDVDEGKRKAKPSGATKKRAKT